MDAEQQKIADFLRKAPAGARLPFKDFLPLFPSKGPRDVKKILTSMANQDLLDYWQSGGVIAYSLRDTSEE